MTDAWDGRPANQERDGWHWLIMAKWPLAKPTIRYWYSGDKDWSDGVGCAQPISTWRYLGPCLTPAEVAAREHAAWRAGRDAAAVLLEDRALTHAARHVRCLAPPATLAAAATVDAVAQEREACAVIAETMPQPHTENQACSGGPKWRTPDPGGWPEAIAAAIRARGGSASA